MSSASDRVVIPQVRKVEQALLGFEDLYLGDIANLGPDQLRPRRLSRALAALAARIATGCDKKDACATVVDGLKDHGIDAIAFAANPAHVYLVQAKWSDAGTAILDRTAANELVIGLDRIGNELFNQFNPRAEVLAERAKELMTQESADITLLIALMGTAEPSPPVLEILDNARARYNRHGDRLDYRFIHAAELFNQVKLDLKPAPVEITVTLKQWFDVSRPKLSFTGVLPASEIGAWYEQWHERLFDLNIRNPLGGTKTNTGIKRTLIDEPGNFPYYNNGVTLLCDSLKPSYTYVDSPYNGPVTLKLTGASVVNGAQTVRSIVEALAEAPDRAANALVGVRVIVTGGAEAFARRVTEATNLQNRVESRDLIALETVQGDIRADLAMTFAGPDYTFKEYTFKRGVADPTPEAGASIVETGIALACAHPSPKIVARIGRSLEPLFERGEEGTYDLLFGEQPSAHQIWRSVITLRAVRTAIQVRRGRLNDRAASICQHGEFLLAHLAFQHLDTSGIEEPDCPWQTVVLDKVDETVSRVLPSFIRGMDALYLKDSITATVSDLDRCTTLANHVSLELRATGGESGPLLAEYQRKVPHKRRQNTVPLLVDRQAVSEGTPLEFRAATKPEEAALSAWLAADPRRGRASWVNDRKRPLLWAADSKQHSPSGLVHDMWIEADWKDRPVSNQGPARWFLPDGKSLWSLSWSLPDDEESE